MQAVRDMWLGMALAGLVGCGDQGPPSTELSEAPVVWRATLPALSPPAIDASSVFFALRDHRLASVDKVSGAVRWIVWTGEAGSNAAIVDSPVRVGNVVVFGDESLYAFDATSGVRVWKFTGSGAVLSRPGIYPFKTDGVRVYAGSASGSVFAIDHATGNQLWRTELLPGTNQVRIVGVRDGRVYVCMRYDGFAFSGKVFALDASSGQVAWSYELVKTPGRTTGTRDAILAEWSETTFLVVSFDDAQIVALRTGDGTPEWTIPRLEEIQSQNDWRALAASNDVLVATSSETGLVIGYDIVDGRELWREQGGQGSMAHRLSADEELVYVPFSSGHLGAYEWNTGRRQWLRRVQLGHLYNPPTVTDDRLFIGAWDAAYALGK